MSTVNDLRHMKIGATVTIKSSAELGRICKEPSCIKCRDSISFQALAKWPNTRFTVEGHNGEGRARITLPTLGSWWVCACVTENAKPFSGSKPDSSKKLTDYPDGAKIFIKDTANLKAAREAGNCQWCIRTFRHFHCRKSILQRACETVTLEIIGAGGEKRATYKEALCSTTRVLCMCAVESINGEKVVKAVAKDLTGLALAAKDPAAYIAQVEKGMGGGK